MSKNELGSGAFGTVFIATYKQKDCAAKMLSHHARDLFRGMKTGPVQQARQQCLLKECAILSTLRHENVVQHITTVIEPCNILPILVIELMDCNLKNFIKKDLRPLNLHQQLTICHGISCGLDYLHTNNIIHRDLCDDNILLRREPWGQLAVKISDFGMSSISP